MERRLDWNVKVSAKTRRRESEAFIEIVRCVP